MTGSSSLLAHSLPTYTWEVFDLRDGRTLALCTTEADAARLCEGLGWRDYDAFDTAQGVRRVGG